RGILRLQAALEPAQSMDIQFPGMAELVEAVTEWQAEAEVTAAIGEIQNLVESMTAPEFQGLDDLAQEVLELNEEQILVESGWVEQLTELTTQINELVEPQQMEFEGLDQL
ncbi:hypothetical protein ACSYAD_36160, partial [Acaryochloris marina NIES-2412]|uniref:hypothetical protein n=1 Tax=Acaryochloris marina TaxID=155978 RepID=UPI004057E74C